VKHSVESPIFTADAVLARGQEVIRIEAQALTMLSRSLDENFVEACHAIFNAKRRVVVTGMGKSGHIARKVAATLAATGTPAFFVHPAEASHGDLGMLARGDILLVMSNSGNTVELRPILRYAREQSIRIIGIASRPTSPVMEYADIRLCTPSTREACAANVAPTTSTTLQLALGDALALAVMDMRGVTSEHLRSFHPAGTIGLRLTPISDIMHRADHLPIVPSHMPVTDVISMMSSCNFGIAGVIDEAGGLVGVITDGDLRRHFTSLDCATATEIMTRDPKTLPADMMAEDALLFLNDTKITAAFVVDRLDTHHTRPIGLVHIHDFVRFGLN
jgi:arabinose-5-phosphate isomerase